MPASWGTFVVLIVILNNAVPFMSQEVSGNQDVTVIDVRSAYEVNTEPAVEKPAKNVIGAFRAFQTHPPSYSIHDAGDEAEFGCDADLIYSQFDVVWRIRSASKTVTLTYANVSFADASSDLYVNENNTLVFTNVKREHSGLYSCVLYDSSADNITAIANMHLYVVDLSDISYTRSLLFGLLGAALITLFIFSVNILLNKNLQSKASNETSLEMNDVRENIIPKHRNDLNEDI